MTAFHFPVPHRGWVVLLLVVGAVTQFAGGLTVVVELIRSRREANRLGEDVLRFSSGASIPTDETSVMVQLAQLRPVVRRMLQASRLRGLGVVFLFVGLALETAGGVWALYLGPAVSTQVIK